MHVGWQGLQLPRLGQRKLLVEVGEERDRGEMLQARGSVRGRVARSWDVVGLVAVAVKALVGARDLAQSGGGA